MYENVTHNQVVPKELLWKDTPKARLGDVDWLLSVIDWELNVDPDFVKNRVAMQQEHMGTVWQKFDGMVRAIVPLFETEIRGLPMLGRLRDSLFV